ncbi:SDR family NAD(P)-dependent oxidoreductase [Enhygromyxa salina]|uniref:Sorbitol dehydrogenase n=1 Tax=Enhygromyxa salina TaxID=215803 RepID=A0A2S9XU56_9BACT|nr:SDR family NAD(P)-dependent oxidoreductase [Enhygromyxa salina]PRP96382.1 Sorbitol dehydrogenase [Enhygromyxa salina]
MRETIQPQFVERYGPWALIAGASEGLGEAYAHALARRGLNVILIARREQPLRTTASAISERHGVEVHTLALDLADPELLERVRAGVGPREVGLLIYNAAYSRIGGFFEQTLEDKLRMLDVNCRGPIVLCHELGAAMRARGRGGIVLMSSMAGMQGTPRLAVYAASKSFDLILAESLWGELKGAGVDVLACVAGATRTPGFEAAASTAQGPVMDPAQVVEEALAGLSWRPSTPSMIPGIANKLASLLLARLPRRRRVLIMKAALGDSAS